MSEIDVTKCPCYINRPLHRYDKGCLIQSHAFSEQQTVEKPILRCDEIKNCPIKEHYKQLHRYKQAVEEIKELATVNAINTCWAFLNECDHCEYKKEDNFQCPQTKMKDIFRKCEEMNNE